MALVTPKNNPLFDVVATNIAGSDSVAIQVKTKNNKQGWKLNKTIERRANNPDLFVVLVDIYAENVTDYYVYQYDDLSERIAHLLSEYMGKPKRDGTPRKEPKFAWFDLRDFEGNDHSRKNKWDLIINRLRDDPGPPTGTDPNE